MTPSEYGAACAERDEIDHPLTDEQVEQAVRMFAALEVHGEAA